MYELFFGSGIAHTVAVFSVVIALGVLLGKIKVWGISLGITWVLFAGIFLSHIGMRIEPSILGFVKEFGLIHPVYLLGHRDADHHDGRYPFGCGNQYSRFGCGSASGGGYGRG